MRPARISIGRGVSQRWRRIWKAGFSSAILLTLAISAPAALAQTATGPSAGPRPQAPPPRGSRMNADQVLKGQPVKTSFDEVPTIIGPGYEVVVTDDAGRRTRGLVSSISRDRIAVFRDKSPVLLLFSPRQERVYPAASVARIEIVDSTVNGMLIGLATTPAIIYAIHRWEQHAEPDPNNRGLATLVFGGFSIPVAIYIGKMIDLAVNRPIYERPSRLSGVSITPWLDHGRRLIVLQISFR
jgi:hypothetical protein